MGSVSQNKGYISRLSFFPAGLLLLSASLGRLLHERGVRLNDYLASTGCPGVVHESFTTTFVAEELAGGAVEDL